MSYTALVELVYSTNELGITCDHELEVVREGAMHLEQAGWASRWNLRMTGRERPYNPCGYRVSSLVAAIQRNGVPGMLQNIHRRSGGSLLTVW